MLQLAIAATELPPFQASIQPIPDLVRSQMQENTWHTGCPVAIDDLAYVSLRFYSFEHDAQQGVLIVNKTLADEVVAIFKQLYQQRFPIQRMQPMYHYHGDDDAAMQDNNTSAFNCRQVTGHPGIYSQHSYGRAIDINPIINPYKKGNSILPADAKSYVDRCQAHAGKIKADGTVYNAFIAKRWDWGGHWYDVHDYQHFEKRAHGALRNPFGYSN